MKWVAVQKGDTVRMEAFAHYEAMQVNQTSTWQQGLAGFLLGSLANSIYSPTLENGLPNPAYQQLVLLGSTLAALGMGNLTQPDPSVPRAYLKYIHYDQDSQFVSQGIVPITSEAGSSYEALILQLVAQEDGFVQFFVANETLRDVYFDDITGMVRRPKIIQEGHYNPFGLPLAGLTTLGNPEYAYFFTGKELYEDEALQWYDYGARMYDAQIGRWTTHDPIYQDASPYSFCGDNAINKVDLDGRWSEGNVGPGYYPDPNPQFWTYGGATYYRPNGLSAWTDIGNLNHRQSLQFNDPKFKEAEWTRTQYDLTYSRLSGIDYYEAMDNLPTFSFASGIELSKEISRLLDYQVALKDAISDFAIMRGVNSGWRDAYDRTEFQAIMGEESGQAKIKIGGTWDQLYTTSTLRNLTAQSGGGDLINPSGGALRGQDAYGNGHFGASRDGGGRKHMGIDILTTVGQNLVSPVTGKAVNYTGTTSGKPMIDITPSNAALGIDKVRILYVNMPGGVNAWSPYNVTAGQTLIGTAADLGTLGYPKGITPHIHVQVMVGGKWVDPTPYFFGR